MSLTAIAQRGGHKKRIKALKIAFITENLDLTEKEAQEFWPVYNTYEDESSRLKHTEMRAIRKEIRENLNSMSNAEAETLIAKFSNVEERLYKLRKEFAKKLLNIIPAKKIIKLKIAEEDFKRKMIEEFKKRRQLGRE